MNAIRTIALQAFRLLYRDKMAFLWMLIIPVVYMFVFGSAFSDSGDPSRTKAFLAIYNKDDGFLSERLMEAIQSESIAIDTLAALPAEPPTRMLVIPDSFTTRILNGQKVVLEFSKKSGTNIEAEATAELSIRKAYLRLLADLAELKITKLPVDMIELRKLDAREPRITVETALAGRHVKIPSGFNHQVPANVVMFTLLTLFLYGGNSMLEEKKSGAFRRIKVAPVSQGQLFVGKLLNVLLIGLVQIGLLLFVGRFVFGVYYGDSPIALGLTSLLFALCVGAMGLCLGFLFNNDDRLVGTAIILSLVMAATSGCWWPAEVSPRWMQNFSMLLPSGLALRSYQMLISYGYGLAQIWPYLAGLAALTGLFSVLLARFLSKTDVA